MDFWIVFLTGLTVGGLTCLVVQGGLLASTIAARAEEEIDAHHKKISLIFPVFVFLITKFVSYTILGFVLGALGRSLVISDQVRVIIQLVAGLYMVVVALNLFNVHPIFRYAIIQPPRFFSRLIRNQSKSKDLFAPAILGFMTIFIPCGTTLAMEALAISTADPFLGASIMAVFTLGTSPLFLLIGFLTGSLSGIFKQGFLKFAAVAVLYLGIVSINGSLILLGSPITLQKLAEASPIQIDFSGESEAATDLSTGNLVDGTRVFDINITQNGYSPTYLRARKGEKVKLNLISNGAYTCAAAFRIPELGIAKDLKPIGTDFVEFTPTRSGRITFACSMGMYTGVIEVLDENGGAS